MSPNSKLLIDTLHATPLFEGRYAQIRWINFDPLTGRKRGYFSLVFSATDVTTGRRVALKFYDPDPMLAFDAYRLDAFRKEPEILQVLLGNRRCLQLAADLATYHLPVAGAGATVPCLYFAVEWIDDQIDHFFDQQHAYSAIEKLSLFHDIVLSVLALHRAEVHHRDLKPDNLRQYTDGIKRIVVAIDLGTAARLNSPHLLGAYAGPVGLTAYSPPEAFAGLATQRKIASLTDVYALGCMLFELFNLDHFYTAFRARNPHVDAVIYALQLECNKHSSLDDKQAAWEANVGRLGRGVNEVGAATSGSSVPGALRDIIEGLVNTMTEFDYRKRVRKLELILQRIQIAIKVLRNAALEQRRLEEARRRREAREKIAQQKLAKLRAKGVQQPQLHSPPTK